VRILSEGIEPADAGSANQETPAGWHPIDAVTIPVLDLDAGLGFYRDGLGQRPGGEMTH
jgi:hypothetical protein